MSADPDNLIQIEPETLYSAQEILKRRFFYWINSERTVVRYLQKPEYASILKPKVLGRGNSKRYLVRGEDIIKFRQAFSRNEL